MKKQTIALLREEIAQLKAEMMDTFYHLEGAPLRHKPSPKSYNALECIEHLNLSNEFYKKQIVKKVEAAPALSGDEKLRLTWLGRWLAAQMEPKAKGVKYKMPTFRMLEPESVVNPKLKLQEHIVFAKWLSDMALLDKALHQAETRVVKNLRIKTLFPSLKLSLPNALAFLLAHNRRHLAQAKRAMEHFYRKGE